MGIMITFYKIKSGFKKRTFMSNGQTESSRRDETMPGRTVVGKYAYTCPLVWSHRTHRNSYFHTEVL